VSESTIYECDRCGSTYTVPGDDKFTTITVSYHDDDREDWSESFCPECGDKLLEDAIEFVPDAGGVDE
jgi:DNA-directed RNA polymerase subunit RPC12/RpoP